MSTWCTWGVFNSRHAYGTMASWSTNQLISWSGCDVRQAKVCSYFRLIYRRLSSGVVLDRDRSGSLVMQATRVDNCQYLPSRWKFVWGKFFSSGIYSVFLTSPELNLCQIIDVWSKIKLTLSVQKRQELENNCVPIPQIGICRLGSHVSNYYNFLL